MSYWLSCAVWRWACVLVPEEDKREYDGTDWSHIQGDEWAEPHKVPTHSETTRLWLAWPTRRDGNVLKSVVIFILSMEHWPMLCFTGEAVKWADGWPDTLVPAQHSQEAQSVERAVREAGLGRQLPHICHRSPANGQGRHVLPPWPGQDHHGPGMRSVSGKLLYIHFLPQKW